MTRDRWFDAVIDGLAVARLARLATIDELPLVKRPRDAILKRYPPHGATLRGRSVDDPNETAGADAQGCWLITQTGEDSAETGWVTRPDGRPLTGMVGTGPGGVRMLYVDDASGSPLGYWSSCPWCTAAPISLVALLGRRFAPRVWDVVARWLALQMVAGLLNAHA